MYDLVIVGAGPAGMTAAIYALRNNLTVALLEASVPGGVIVNTAVVENYPGFKKIDGPDLAYSMFEQATSLGAVYYSLTVTGIEVEEGYFNVLGNDEIVQGKSVILASGTRQKKLGIPGEERFSSRGISWCAVCDGSLFRGRDVAVIGGGNSAFEETIYLSNLVNKIYLVHRREGFRADKSIVDKVRKLKNVEMFLNYQPIEFIGGDVLEGIIINNLKTDEVKTIKVDGCFEFVGTLPSTEYLENLGILANNGYIKVDKKCRTSIAGLFACGDVIDKDIRQIATAINDGAIAALNAIKYCTI